MDILNQDKLRELEALCVADQPPAAMSACPLHVDCRSLCAAVSSGDFTSARGIYVKTVPFPYILSQLCDEPCKKKCYRGKAGDPLELRGLEQVVMTESKQQKKRGFLPRRNHTAAVVGGGLFGLTGALELAKKGIKVTLYEAGEQLGGRLLDLIDHELLALELQVLGEYPIKICLKSRMNDIDTLTKKFDAVLAACDTDAIGLQVNTTDYLTNMESVFSRRDEGGFPVSGIMADAKRAAISMDRWIKKVSMTAGREKEGVCETKLYVNMNGRLPMQLKAKPPFGTDEAIEEAKRCLDCQCMECVKGCAFMSHYKSYPGKYVREVYNNLSIAMGTRHANKMINSCSLCGQCAAICPNGLNLGAIIKEARQIMVRTNKMPQSAFEFALNDLTFSQSDQFSLCRSQAGLENSHYLFFPGCQLPASAPDIVLDAYQDLCRYLSGGVGLYLDCCGIIADWAGESERFEESMTRFQTKWNELGRPVIIAACPTCYQVLYDHISQIELVGIWDILETIIPIPAQVGNNQKDVREKPLITIHDACGARNQPQIQKSIRKLTEKLGYIVKEDMFSKDKTACCGFGGLSEVSAKEVSDQMAKQVIRDEETQLCLTYCINCRDRITKHGKRTLHILELFYNQKAGQIHQIPTFSQRRNNRIYIKRQALKQIWHEEEEQGETMKLYYDQIVEKQLEDRMILESDITSVLEKALQNNEFIIQKATGTYIARGQVGYVTFWVYFKEENDGYRIEKAYSHRMVIGEE